ncbi:hypothetical protein BC830DRAFT_1172548 [Chytriomyces sp. MP71]|nr:hypothetical protein BC830DRAFT_1172548 [Chytriomyces sp. MP71]
MLTTASTEAAGPPHSPLTSALNAQGRARDTLLMPPPPRQVPKQRQQTQAAPEAKSNFDGKKGFASPTASSAARAASVSVASLTSNLRPKSAASSLSLKRNASKVNSPATPRPVTATSLSSSSINQLSRPSQKPKPFHQKLLDANLSTPPKASLKNPVTPLQSAFEVPASGKADNMSLQTNIRNLTDFLNEEKAKVTLLEGLLRSRNAFISNIEKIAQSTTERLANNQTVLMAHLEDTKKMETENATLKARFAVAMNFMTIQQRELVLKADVVSTNDVNQALSQRLDHLTL